MADNINLNVEIHGEGNIVIGKGNVTINPLPPAEARLRHDLGILLKNIQTTWIKGVLEKSVHEAALLELGMELREEAINNPWRVVLEGPDQPRQMLPRGSKIKDIFDEANHFLLILGEPGSGKTTTLLQLARALIAEEDKSFTQPIPVILNLSTWTNKQQPLDEWLVAELNSKYRLPKKDGKSWLRDHRILPLLDGLDEVKVENRVACVEKINQLVVDYGLQGLVVCSRFKDYIALNVRLAFYRAVYIQPLTNEQIDEYLDMAGDKLISLRATLRSDEALQSMTRSPLILNIMSLAYQNSSAEALSNPALASDEARLHHLFDTYIARMFSRRPGARPYNDKQIKQHLTWLAQNMHQHHQEVFLIEGLQPSWLRTRMWQWLYFFASRLISGLIFGLSCGLVIGMLSFIGGTIYGLVAGFSLSLIDVLRYEWLRRREKGIASPTFWWSILNIVVVGLVGGLIGGLLVGLISGLLYGYGLLEALVTVLTYGLIWGLLFGLIFGLRGSQQSFEKDIQTVETLRWSWPKAVRGGLIGGIVGLIGGVFVGVIGGLAQTPKYDGLIWRLLFELLFGLTFGLPSALFGSLVGLILNGLRREIIETKSTINQGIWLSIRNAISGGLLGGLFGGLLGGLIFGPLFGLYLGMSSGSIGVLIGVLVGGLKTGLSFALIAALWFGGLDVIQHYTLRVILLIQGNTPDNYTSFLNYAVDRIFLQKVGGGYRFIHRLLLEHFANMDETTKRT